MRFHYPPDALGNISPRSVPVDDLDSRRVLAAEFQIRCPYFAVKLDRLLIHAVRLSAEARPRSIQPGFRIDIDADGQVGMKTVTGDIMKLHHNVSP